MSTKNKGDILVERIEEILKLPHYADDKIRKALADYRRPWTLGLSVNGFTLGEGQEWHRNDGWTEVRLPDGWRPLIEKEYLKRGDKWIHEKTVPELNLGNWMTWLSEHPDRTRPAEEHKDCYLVTRRPLPEVKKPVLTAEQIADGWIEWPGGECPVWGGSEPKYILREAPKKLFDRLAASELRWSHIGSGGDIIAYRPDPYESLKKAHADGKALQFRNANSGGAWSQWHAWNGTGEISGNGGYREWQIKPEPEKWASEKAAFAAGKTIQWRFKGARINGVWHTCPTHRQMGGREMSDGQLKAALAKMLPPETVEIIQRENGGPYTLSWFESDYDVIETELLHLCSLVEGGLTDKEHRFFRVYLFTDAYNSGAVMDNDRAERMRVSATWQQRTEALAKIKQIEL